MKRFIVILSATGLLAGCAHYDMALTNGERIVNVSKPRLDATNGVYFYKDVTGTERYISAGRVIQISPHSSKYNNAFNPP